MSDGARGAVVMALVMTAWIGGPGAVYRVRRFLARRGYFVAAVRGGEPQEWAGAASVPHGTFGRLQVPRSRATLSLRPGTLTLAARPLLGRKPPPRSWSAASAGDLTVFVVRGWTRCRGIGVRVAGEREYYFWPGPALRDIRVALVENGFPVSDKEQVAQYN